MIGKSWKFIPLTETLKPAIDYARNGFPVSPTCSFAWQKAYEKYKNETEGDEFQPWFKTFAPNGRAPLAGETWHSTDHARTLDLIARTDAEAFYRGELAEKINAFSHRYNGFLTADDLASFEPQWVEPIGVDYHGYTVWEIPPNGQGLVALMALNILKDFSFTEREAVDTIHTQIEAIKLAFSDGMRYITDPARMNVLVEDLLSESFAKKQRSLMVARPLRVVVL